MSRIVSVLALVIVGLMILGAIGPALTGVLSALVWLIVAGGLIACLVRVVWSATRRW